MEHSSLVFDLNPDPPLSTKAFIVLGFARWIMWRLPAFWFEGILLTVPH
jgi:hypothetical protein